MSRYSSWWHVHILCFFGLSNLRFSHSTIELIEKLDTICCYLPLGHPARLLFHANLLLRTHYRPLRSRQFQYSRSKRRTWLFRTSVRISFWKRPHIVYCALAVITYAIVMALPLWTLPKVRISLAKKIAPRSLLALASFAMTSSIIWCVISIAGPCQSLRKVPTRATIEEFVCNSRYKRTHPWSIILRRQRFWKSDLQSWSN